MNDYLIFGASGLTGNYFLYLVQKEGQKYHLFVRSLIPNEQESNQTSFSFENINDLPPSKNLVICLGYPLNFKELIYMDKKTKDTFKKVDFDLVIEIAKKAKDLGIPEDLYREHLLLDPDQKIGSLMDISMDKDVAKGWFGAAPPDLTLISRAKKPEYLYTYLRTFYQDDSRPYGVNNLVYPNVGMPHVLLELQGLPQCEHADDSHAGEGHCDSLEVASAGIMTTDQFDDAMYDLVNFLAYTAEPYKADRLRIGTYVLLFLALFFIFAWLLNREYWKDVH